MEMLSAQNVMFIQKQPNSPCPSLLISLIKCPESQSSFITSECDQIYAHLVAKSKLIVLTNHSGYQTFLELPAYLLCPAVGGTAKRAVEVA
jgi:hypothetical protein